MPLRQSSRTAEAISMICKSAGYSMRPGRMPAQRRDARGKVAATQSQLMQIQRQLQFAKDKIRAEVQDTYSALERAYDGRPRESRGKPLARVDSVRKECCFFLHGRSSQVTGSPRRKNPRRPAAAGPGMRRGAFGFS